MKILEIEILASDLETAREFYSEKLGLNLISKTEGHFSVQAGNSTITFRKCDRDQKPVYHFAFNIPNNQLSEALSWIKERAELIWVEEQKEIADFDNWNARAFYFYDPLGNILECLARYALNNQSSKEFGSHSLLCVSEIATVTGNVNVLADQLHNERGLPFFAKQPRHDNFTVMGDDNGLLIISEEDRHWFPTQHLAKRYPVKIRISDQTRMISLDFNQDPGQQEHG